MDEPIRGKVDRLEVQVHRDREAMGRAAAAAVAVLIRRLLTEQETVGMIFAAAPSQNEFLAALCAEQGLDWSRIRAFHMDEYLDLAEEAPQRFALYLKEHIFGRVNPGAVHYLNSRPSSPEDECARYARLLRDNPADICCLGIGENGHLAFNDPPVADFDDPCLVKVVRLESACRLQQVHDGCFPSVERVPTHALSLTIPALFRSRWMHCLVPGPTKREAVRKTLRGPIETACPASILRTHGRAVLYLDRDSAGELSF